jgi:hypothetical protein
MCLKAADVYTVLTCEEHQKLLEHAQLLRCELARFHVYSGVVLGHLRIQSMHVYMHICIYTQLTRCHFIYFI